MMVRTTAAGWLIAVAILVPPTASGQQRDPRATSAVSASDPRTASISGVVVDRQQQPIASVTIRLAGEGVSGLRVTVTDRAGRFAFERLAGTRYELFATRAGYAAQWYGQSRQKPDGDLVPVAAGQAVTNISFVLTRYAVISGTVTDMNGEPAQATVTLMGRRDGPYSAPQNSSTRTDFRGRFRVAAPDGDFVVAARPDDLPDLRMTSPDGRSQPLVMVTTFYPGTTRIEEAAFLRLGEGEEREGINLQIPAMPAGVLEGQLLHPSGLAVTPTKIIIAPRAGARLGQAVNTVSEGRFRAASVIAGDYDVLATGYVKPDGETPVYGWARGSVVISAGLEPSRVTLTLTDGGTIRGRVLVAGSAALPMPTQLTLFPASLSPVEPSFGLINKAVEPTGDFSLLNVPPGRYRVGLTLPKTSRLSIDRVQVGETDVADVEIGSGAELNLLIRMDDTEAEISGTVTRADGQPLAGVNVAAIPEPATPEVPALRLLSNTDAQGRYVLSGVPRGTYRVMLLEFAYTSTNILSGERGSISGSTSVTPGPIVVIDAKGQKKVVDIRR